MRITRLSIFSVLAVTSSFAAACQDGEGGAGGGGAGGGAAVPARFASGTRLKVRVARAGDAEQFYGIHDAMLDTDCGIQSAADGSRRCVPYSNGTVLYSDASCTVAVLTYGGGTCGDPVVPTYASASIPTTDACTTETAARAYQVGAAISPAPAMLYQLGPTGCSPNGPSAMVFALTEVAPDTLASIDVATEARGSDIEVSYFTSGDGFRLLQDSPRDVKRQADCTPRALGGVFVCAPKGPDAYVGTFSDPACMTPNAPGVASVTTGCASPSVAFATPSPTACYEESLAYALGAPTAAVYTLDGVGTCASLGGGSQTYTLLGAQIPATEFPPLELAKLGTGPVRVALASVQGAPIVSYGQFVTESGELCFPYGFSDGVTRCGPPTRAYVYPPSMGRTYADAACTQTIVDAPDDPCFMPLTKAVAATAACGGGYEIYELGAAYTGPVFMSQGGACASVAPPVGASYRHVGALIPNDQFATVTIETL